jgi:hypothetical protein
MIAKTKQLRAPANGKTDVYMTVRSTPEYAMWLAWISTQGKPVNKSA